MLGRSILMMALVPATGVCDDWPGWRGPMGNGVSGEDVLPVRWGAGENIRWKAALPGVGVSGPIVHGERVFVTASDGRRNERLHVLCFDRRSGARLWQTRLFGSMIPESEFPPGGMAVPTPTTNGKLVFALFGTGELAALDFDGKPVWFVSLTEAYGVFRNRWGMGSSPLLVNDLLVVQVDHWSQSYLLAVEAATGKVRWRRPRDASVNWSSPVLARVGGVQQLVLAGTYRVQGYDPADGRELWSVRGMQMQCIPSPVVDGERVYAVSGRKGSSLAIRLDGSRGDLTDSHVVWSKARGAPYVPSGLCYRGGYYLVDDDGMATRFNAGTGEVEWQERVRGKYHASLVAGGGNVYFTTLEGVVYVVKAAPTFELLARNRLGEQIVASPAVANGHIYLRGERHLYCVGE